MNSNSTEIVSMVGLSISLVASIAVFVYILASVGLVGWWARQPLRQRLPPRTIDVRARRATWISRRWPSRRVVPGY